jgi:hypothetical protein
MKTLQEVKDAGGFTCNISHLNRLCSKVKESPAKVYELIREYGGEADSFTRETIFSYIADKYHNGNYDKVYDQWLATSVN